jgi:hypothetical protein
MSIKLWYCDTMKLWRWTLTDSRRPIIRRESGQNCDMDVAMKEASMAAKLWENKNP